MGEDRHTAPLTEEEVLDGVEPISPSDPLVILAGIKQFGLASDGSDLRDLADALERMAINKSDWDAVINQNAALRAELELERARKHNEKCEPCGANPYEDCPFGTDQEMLALRAENERFKGQGVRATRLWQDAQAEIARLKELYSEQVQRADKYFIDSQRLRAALEEYAKLEGPPYRGTPFLARAALGGEHDQTTR